MLDTETRRTYAAFNDRSLPKSAWTHDAHLTVCWAALATRTQHEALVYLRDGIRSYNEATGVPNTSTSGYHETLTAFYVAAVASVDAGTIEEVVSAPQCARDAPLRHWSRTLLFSAEARAGWVDPDLRALGT